MSRENLVRKPVGERQHLLSTGTTPTAPINPELFILGSITVIIEEDYAWKFITHP
jgi:hypothetical protein